MDECVLLAARGKVGGLELGESAGLERGLEIFQGERVGDRGGGRGSGCDGQDGDDGSEGEELEGCEHGRWELCGGVLDVYYARRERRSGELELYYIYSPRIE